MRLINLFIFFDIITPHAIWANVGSADSIPDSHLKKISNEVSIFLQARRPSTSSYLSGFKVSDLNQNQLDSILLLFENDTLVGRGFSLLIGHWHLNSEHIHERLCSFIELDTTDYEGRWGENRRMSNRSREIGARLALAKLGYQYHIDFIEGIFREQDISNYRMATLLTDFTLYLSNDQILNALFDLALTSQHYRYIEHDNHTFEWVQYYLLTYVFHSLHRHLTYNETVVYKNLEEYTWDDYLMLSKWVDEVLPKNWTVK